ncbi:exonuclease domain-containing protein [Ferruginibacter yonginensis]|uniref:Exonuclease domain-containing protein n=1 Tax=Ferruginibacter yonginensis TaxID=1310416 RepID=A0ABV8QPH5_9BACT
MYAIVDIETTGGHASSNGITEIAIHIHNGERVVKHFTTLLNPQKAIPQFITALTGIDNSMVANAPTFDEVAPVIYDMLKDVVFVAHNVNFDYSFVFHHLKKYGYVLNVKKLCTVRLSRKVIPGLPSYSLGKLCESIGITTHNRHRADGDAQATVQLFEHLLALGGLSHIDKMLKRTSAEHWLPIHLDKHIIDALPNSPGVYYFHNNKGKILYVGKAVDIKKRVTSHFTHNDDGKRRQYFLQQVTNITYTLCANELHALVLESTEIKKLWPPFNYSQKQPMQKFALYCFEDNVGYKRLAIDKRKKNLPALYCFNTLNEGLVLLRKMTEQFELNQKLCFIDKTVITAEEKSTITPPHLYNHKVQQALTALEQQLPSFAVLDEGLTPNDQLCLLIEKGSFWGMGYISNTSTALDINTIKENIEPYMDNDFIRNTIFNYAEQYPEKKIVFN